MSHYFLLVDIFCALISLSIYLSVTFWHPMSVRFENISFSIVSSYLVIKIIITIVIIIVKNKHIRTVRESLYVISTKVGLNAKCFPSYFLYFIRTTTAYPISARSTCFTQAYKVFVHTPSLLLRDLLITFPSF